MTQSVPRQNNKFYLPEVSKKATRTLIKVRVDVRRGAASPAQKAVWRKFWQKLVAEVKKNGKQNMD
jgi:hypothetical protein